MCGDIVINNNKFLYFNQCKQSYKTRCNMIIKVLSYRKKNIESNKKTFIKDKIIKVTF